MKRRQLVERLDRVAAVCRSASGSSLADHGETVQALDDVARLESWTAARRAELVRMLKNRPGSFPEADVADTTGCTLGAAGKETERAETLDAAESFADALDDGDIRPGHVDALTRTVKNLTDEQAATLLADQELLAKQAAQSSISAFEKMLKRRAAKLQSERDAEARLERQKKATRLRSWIDQADGMWCLSGRFDPATGSNLQRILDDAVRNLFNEQVPDTAPTDRLERQQHLNALALTRLIEGTAPASSRPGPPLVVVHTTTNGNTINTGARAGTSGSTSAGSADAGSTVSGSTTADDPAGSGTGADDGTQPPSADATTTDTSGLGFTVEWGLPIELPPSVLRDLFDNHDPDIVVVADGIILHAAGNLNLGRSTRLANRAQRRALRALYSTCAVPGCSVHYDRCKLHHIVWWRNGGRTDLSNLLPVCQHHHTRIHNDLWQIHLGPQRELTIILPDGRTLTGSPAPPPGTPPERRAA